MQRTLIPWITLGTWLCCRAPVPGQAITDLGVDRRSFSVSWSASTSTVYELQWTDDLLSGSWTPLRFFAPRDAAPRFNDLFPHDGPTTFLAVNSFLPPVPAGGTLTTYVDSPPNGLIAVQIRVPALPRFTYSAPVVVPVSQFFTPPATFDQFWEGPDFTEIGCIQISYLWPGIQGIDGAASEGVFDYGGRSCIRALRDVIRFATGNRTAHQGRYLHEMIAVTPRYDNAGLYAFSHPGIAAVNVLADWTGSMTNVAWLVGRENPTVDAISAVEIGHFIDQTNAVQNPLYSLAKYTPTNIAIDYGTIDWDPAEERPFFDLNTNGVVDGGDHRLGSAVPSVSGQRCYSIALVDALGSSPGAPSPWPTNLANAATVSSFWAYRSIADRYPDLSALSNSLHVLILFARRDHVQPAVDKPHVHHAYEGFRYGAGVWTRLNPDAVYMEWAHAGYGGLAADQPANQQPGNWNDIEGWAYMNPPHGPARYPPFAAVAEMVDRQQTGTWVNNLSVGPLVGYPPPP